MNKIVVAVLAAVGLLGLSAGSACAQSDGALQHVTLSVVGSWSSLPLDQKFEKPFWTQTLPKDSNGAINVQMTTFDQMGISGSDVFRLLKNGVFDVGMTVGDYEASDAPALEGLDVPLVATTAAEDHQMVDAARPMIASIMKHRFDAKLLAIVPYPPQVVFCKTPISSLKDLKGKKVRGSDRMTTQFLDALGAQGVNISFSEVPGALQRGVIDCAITGAGSGYSASWYQSAHYLMTLPLGGWDPVITAMNMKRWTSLNPATQSFIQKEIAEKFEKPVWNAAQHAFDTDIACLTGQGGSCPDGKPAHMTLVKPSSQDMALARKILREKVLPQWAHRIGKQQTQRWNATVGKDVGLQIATP